MFLLRNTLPLSRRPAATPHRRAIKKIACCCLCVLTILILWLYRGTSKGPVSVPSHPSGRLQFRAQVSEAPTPAPPPPNLHSNRPALARVLVLYFPQFHEFEVNNVLWGKGYTDFVGVQAATGSSPSGPVPNYPVIRPRDGFYDLTAKWVRQRQARQARTAGIHGFVYYHYWFKGGPVMEKPLELLLQDGEPNLPFAISWANENWTKRWDGGDNAVLMKQTYEERDWRPHFDWLARFFVHPAYIRRQGKPMLFLYRVHDVTGLGEMLTHWQRWAVEAGLGGLYIVQTNGIQWSPTAYEKSPAVDAAMEFYPVFYNFHGSHQDLGDVVSTDPGQFGVPLEHYMFGAHAGWNNMPRHLKDGKETVLPTHPINLRAMLRQQLRRSHPDSFVVINAWNEWGEGAAIEPSVEHGDSWLRAIEGAIADAATWRHELEVAPAGVGAMQSTPADKVCIVVRTYAGHKDGGLFSLRKTLATLQALQHQHWDAYIVDTGEAPFKGMQAIVDSFGDGRLHVVTLPDGLRHQKYDARTSAYNVTDYVVDAFCTKNQQSPSSYRWFLVTNGDNFYAPDALNHLPAGKDALFMNFYSRYTLANALASTASAWNTHCCTRLLNGQCHVSSPRIGHVDVGAMVMRTASWAKAGLSFSQFHGACGSDSCHDGALAEHVDARLHWDIANHDPHACAFLHNPNPAACKLVGGVYFDDPDWRKAGCYERSTLTGMAGVDWAKFMGTDACVCQRDHSLPTS